MNILFLSVYEIKDSDSGYIYADLIREFAKHKHNIFAVTPTKNSTECLIDGNGVKVIKVKNGQIQKTGKIKKVINLLSLENKTIKAVEKYAKNVKFDMIINMCSNLCFAKTSSYFKKRDQAVNYLLLKDIFPQNAVDIGMMKTTGIMGSVYRQFRRKEKKLYNSADYIGCMSQANVVYIATHNPEIDKMKLSIVPNSIEPIDVSLTECEKVAMREKYNIPQDKGVFVYGGNLGRPQGILFIIDCLRSQKENEKIFFLIVGDGTEYSILEQYVENEKPSNVKLMKRLPREDFDRMLAACDVGMVFLDRRFTIPNYPSRLLSYMQAGLPVIACTDTNTDVGKDIIKGNFGWWCESGNIKAFNNCMIQAQEEYKLKASNAKLLLRNNYSVVSCYETIVNGLE